MCSGFDRPHTRKRGDSNAQSTRACDEGSVEHASSEHTPIEVIVVIDGEDQATEKLLAGFEDARLQVIPLAVNVGGSEARNIGVRTENGEWIAFLDDDDEWFPHKIAMQLEAAGAS